MTTPPLGAIVPHAPVLATPGARGREELRPAMHAVAEVATRLERGPYVVVSSHGSSSGVYAQGRGGLGGFGMGDVAMDGRVDAGLAAVLAEAWERPMLDHPLDHGCVVAAALLRLQAPVVFAALAEISEDGDLDAALADAEAFAAATAALIDPPGVIVTGHTSAALSPRAPFLRSDDAVTLEEELMEEARRDCGVFAERAKELAEVGRSCGAAALAAFGRMFSGRPLEIVDYSRPYGIGYLTAVVGK